MNSKYELFQSNSKRKQESSLDLFPQKDNLSLNESDKKHISDHMNMKGLKNQTKKRQNKSSDSEVISENEVDKMQNPRLRSQLLEVKDEKNLLMKKFEYSLKQRLLSKAYFAKQVPLFDSITKEKTRNKTPIDNYESNNESVFTSVFPVRKKNDQSINSSTMCEEVFSKHSKESENWLKQLENESTTPKESSSIKDVPIKKSSKSKVHSKPKSKSSADKDNDTKEEIKELKDSEYHQTWDNSAISMAENKRRYIFDSEDTAAESYDTLSKDYERRLSSRENNKANASLMDESEKILEVESKIDTESTSDMKKLNIKRESKGVGSKEKTISKNKSLYTNESSSNFKSTDKMDIIYIEKEVSEKESVEIYGQEGQKLRVRGVVRRQPTLESSSSSTFPGNVSKQFISSQSGGAQAKQYEMIHEDSYNVAYTEAEKKESTMESGPEDDQMVSNYSISVNEANGNTKEELTAQDKRDDEENCIDEPCNEPSWFEDYGIDKKRRHEMGDTKIDKGSSSSSEVEEDILEILPDVTEVVPEVKEEKKKVKKKVKPVEQVKETLDIKTDVVEQQDLELKTIREIKTIPLVCTEDTGKEKTGEKTKQMPMEYFKEYIAQYLIAGLAKVALYMPKDPVEYLAHWLIQERKKETLIDELKKFKAEVKGIRQKNVTEMKKKHQLDYLKEETLKLYNERKDDPLYPCFDSELELYQKGIDYAEQKMVAEDEETVHALNYEDHQR